MNQPVVGFIKHFGCKELELVLQEKYQSSSREQSEVKLDNKHNINPLYGRLNEYSLIHVEECNHFNRLTYSSLLKRSQINIGKFNNLKHF